MKDPHTHVERDVILGPEMRAAFVAVLGNLGGPPKTTATGCGVRRTWASISALPELVTCLACREHAAREHDQAASIARDLAEYMRARPGEPIRAGLTIPELQILAADHQATADAYR
jgi:hypothetical protein